MEHKYNDSAMKAIITYPITLSTHGKYKMFNKKMLAVKELIEKHWEHITAGFDLRTSDLVVRLRPLPRRTTNGTAYNKLNLIQLDISRPIRYVIKTLMHELTHMEQFNTGRLSSKMVGIRQMDKWNDDEWVCSKGFGSTEQSMKAYRNQPWEVEADERQETELKRLEGLIGEIK